MEGHCLMLSRYRNWKTIILFPWLMTFSNLIDIWMPWSMKVAWMKRTSRMLTTPLETPGTWSTSMLQQSTKLKTSTFPMFRFLFKICRTMAGCGEFFLQTILSINFLYQETLNLGLYHYFYNFYQIISIPFCRFEVPGGQELTFISKPSVFSLSINNRSTIFNITTVNITFEHDEDLIGNVSLSFI